MASDIPEPGPNLNVKIQTIMTTMKRPLTRLVTRERRRQNNTHQHRNLNNDILKAYQILELESNAAGGKVKIKLRQLSQT